MDAQFVFEKLKDLLKKIVATRGGDPELLEQEYYWPTAEDSTTPKTAVSLAPLLTGGPALQEAPEARVPEGLAFLGGSLPTTGI